MKRGIPLDTFEDYIDEVVLERGENYALSSAVKIIKRTKNKVEALCRGSGLYEISLKLDDHILVDHECSCPFEYGPVCKHIAAVLYLLRDGHQIDNYIENEINRSSEPKKKFSVDRILQELNNHDMESLIRQWTTNYYRLEKELLEFYKQKKLK